MQVYYCIENDGVKDIGKHKFVNNDVTVPCCKFCFLAKDDANYKPMRKLSDGSFIEVEK